MIVARWLLGLCLIALVVACNPEVKGSPRATHEPTAPTLGAVQTSSAAQPTVERLADPEPVAVVAKPRARATPTTTAKPAPVSKPERTVTPRPAVEPKPVVVEDQETEQTFDYVTPMPRPEVWCVEEIKDLGKGVCG